MRVDQLYRKKSKGKDFDPSISAEVQIVIMLVQNNFFFNLSHYLTPVIKRKFKEGTVAQKFSCSQTKTAAILSCLT